MKKFVIVALAALTALTTIPASGFARDRIGFDSNGVCRDSRGCFNSSGRSFNHGRGDDWRGGRNWHGDRDWRGRRYYRGHNGVGAAIGGLAAGAIIGGIIASQPRARSYGNSHVDWCYSRYRSYRASDNTYQPNYGPRRQCVSP